MTFFEFILPALSVGIFSLVNYRAYSEAFPIRLTRAMLLSFITAVVYVIMGYVGIVVATSLRFRNSDLPDLYNQLNTVVYLGFMVFVVLKWLLGVTKKRLANRVLFDLSSSRTLLVLPFALGINVFLIGFGIGFLPEIALQGLFWKYSLPLLIVTFLMCYWAVMLGRRKIQIREKRWILIASLLLLVLAIMKVINING